MLWAGLMCEGDRSGDQVPRCLNMIKPPCFGLIQCFSNTGWHLAISEDIFYCHNWEVLLVSIVPEILQNVLYIKLLVLSRCLE